MKILKNPTWRLVSPLVLQADFRHRYWYASRRTAYTWLALAFFADLLAKSVVGQWSWWSLALALVVPVAVGKWCPPRFSAAVGGLLVSQALVSIVIAYGLAMFGVQYAWRELALIFWVMWCGFALFHMGLSYFRTPSKEMPDA